MWKIHPVRPDDKEPLSGKGKYFLKGKNIQNLNLKEFARKVAIVQQYNSASMISPLRIW